MIVLSPIRINFLIQAIMKLFSNSCPRSSSSSTINNPRNPLCEHVYHHSPTILLSILVSDIQKCHPKAPWSFPESPSLVSKPPISGQIFKRPPQTTTSWHQSWMELQMRVFAQHGLLSIRQVSFCCLPSKVTSASCDT
jgi:hypothetical protein